MKLSSAHIPCPVCDKSFEFVVMATAGRSDDNTIEFDLSAEPTGDTLKRHAACIEGQP